MLRVIRNLEPLTGSAVDSNDNVFVSEIFAGLLVRITPNGARTYAPVELPTGLEISGGYLYGSALSLAGPAGQVVEIPPGAFGRLAG